MLKLIGCVLLKIKLFWQLGAAVMLMFAPEWLMCIMLFMIFCCYVVSPE